MERYDAAVVGAGILGLAHAYHLARRGRRVVVFERHARAMGASIRNFGLIWPIGQPPGPRLELALRSRAIWLKLLAEAGLWHDCAGSLHLAYHEDEARVLHEFAVLGRDAGAEVALLEPGEVWARSPAVRLEGLVAGLWSPTEVCVDPREVVGALPAFLEERFGVTFVWGTAVLAYEQPRVMTGCGEWEAERLYLCCGDELQTLYPQVLAGAGLARCKLQMLRTQPCPEGWRMGPVLAAGLTLRHYEAFRVCPSLPTLKERIAREMPEYDRYGIHVLVSQNGRGELLLGDSHEWDAAIDPFDRQEIEALILRYLERFFQAPELAIAARWHGTYVKHPTEPYWAGHPAPGVTIVTGVGGAGMTLSFGVAEQVVEETEGRQQ